MTTPEFPTETPGEWPEGLAAQPTAWPAAPPIAQASNVWPPPPSVSPDFQAIRYMIPFKTIFLRIAGPVSDFRTGTIQVHDQGLIIAGKAVHNAEVQIPIMILTAFLRVWLIAVLLMEYAIRKDKWLTIPWEHVQQIGLVPKKRRVCLVFSAPNDKGFVKTFSLAFKLDQEQYDGFVGSVTPFVGLRVADAKLRAWNSPAAVMFLISAGIALGVLLTMSVFGLFQKS